MNTTVVGVLQFVLLIASAPLLGALIARVKAFIQRRQGLPLWRPYADLAKLLRKQDLVPSSAPPLFRFAPAVLAATTVLPAAFVALLLLGLVSVAILAQRANFVAMVTWALGRNFFDISPVHAVAFAALAMVAV